MAVATERITKSPSVCGGSACLRGTRITIWGLVEWRRLGLSDSEIRRRVPDVTAADLEAAWAYASLHPEEIEEAIRRNAEA
jgi:uncharacterized protein (DUF433 family)